MWAAFFNLVAALVFDVHIAKTIGKGLVVIEDVTVYVIMAGLIGAISWNLITWFFGIPSSSSHALIGGYGGAAVAKAGFGVLLLSGWIKTLLFIVLAPVLGMILGYTLQVIVLWVVRKQSYDAVNIVFRKLQLLSAALYSLGHGTNDAQKTMGVITLALIAAKVQSADAGVPWWVILMCGLAIALGTYLGGWRIMRTVGKRITDVEPAQGFAAETSSAATILASSALGFPLSTTQVTSGAVVGAGLGRRLASVHWGIVGRIATGWVLTLPAAALVGGLAALLANVSTLGVVIVAVVGAAAVVGLFLLARRQPVTHENVNDDPDGETSPELASAGSREENGR